MGKSQIFKEGIQKYILNPNNKFNNRIR